MPIETFGYTTPIGYARIEVDAGAVATFSIGANRAPTMCDALAGPIAEALDAYFEGDLDAIRPIPVAPRGTAFQRRVWELLREIPAGATTTYGELAASMSAPGAARAVGLANARNPVWLIVPCHRVIGANGSLTGYAGELWRKRWLLRHEGALIGTGGATGSLFAGSV